MSRSVGWFARQNNLEQKLFLDGDVLIYVSGWRRSSALECQEKLWHFLSTHAKMIPSPLTHDIRHSEGLWQTRATLNQKGFLPQILKCCLPLNNVTSETPLALWNATRPTFSHNALHWLNDYCVHCESSITEWKHSNSIATALQLCYFLIMLGAKYS